MAFLGIKPKKLIGVLKKILSKLVKILPSNQLLSLIGDILAILVPGLDKEDLRKLGEALQGLDDNTTGIDDKLGGVFVELGGGPAEQVVTVDKEIKIKKADLELEEFG